MPSFEDFHGSTEHIEAPDWGLTENEGEQAASSGIPPEGRELYVSDEIRAWREANGIDISPDGHRPDIQTMGNNDRADWLVDARDNTQVEAADRMMGESRDWTLQ